MLATEVDRIAAVQADGVVESSGSHCGLASAIRGATRGGRVVVGLQPSGAHLVAASRFNDEIDDVIAPWPTAASTSPR
jgi:L-idonate 5-dehydrogenase